MSEIYSISIESNGTISGTIVRNHKGEPLKGVKGVSLFFDAEDEVVTAHLEIVAPLVKIRDIKLEENKAKILLRES